MQPEMIHPTIMQDMRAFDGGVPWDAFNGDDGAGGAVAAGASSLTHFNLDFPSTAFPNPQQAEFPLFPDFDFASPAGTVNTPSSGSGGPGSVGANGVGTGSGSGGMGAPPLAHVSPDPWTHPMQAALDPPSGVPVLDASWQAFVEQLGF